VKIRRKRVLLRTLLVIGSTVILAVILALPIMLLWNWLMPTIFGIKKITLLQALGINLLCGFLFKSVREWEE
jgi:hypothetical protein